MADEPSGGALSPSEELEAALAEASTAIEERTRGRDAAAQSAGPGSADKAVLEALAQELQALKTEYEKALAELERTRDQHLRLQAELENFRRRQLKEKQETQLYGHQNVVKELLPVVDNLDRAIEHAEQSASEELQHLLQGVELVRRELLGVLERFGVKPVEAEGQPFDPAVHEALAQAPSTEVEPNTVVQVMQKGYQLRDRMLRPARVVVSKAAQEQDPSQEPGEN